MFTTILAWLCIVAGLGAIGAGAYDTVYLFAATPGTGDRLGRRRYLIAVGMAFAGVGLIALGQALRLLLVVLARA